MVVLAISPAFEHCGAKVSCRHFLLVYGNFAIIAPGVGSRALFEDHNGVLHVPVHEMQSEVGANGLPPWTYLNWSVNGHGRPQEGHPVFLRNMEWKWPC